MKHSISEHILLVCAFSLFAYTFIEGIQNRFTVMYNLLGFLYMTGVFYVTGVLWLGNPETSVINTLYLKPAAGLMGGGWFVITLCYAFYIGHLTGNAIVWWSVFHPAYIMKFLEWLLAGAVAGTVYGVLRRQILNGKIRFKKTAKVTGMLVCAAGLMMLVFYYGSISYSGSDDIRFLDKDQQYTSLEDVLLHPEIAGQTVYVDFWFSSCGPCIAAFRNMGPGKEVLKQNGVVTLYLSREISLPDSKLRWINTIREYNLEGFHVYMSRELEQDIIKQLQENTGLHLAYPHYLLVDETGTVTDWDAPAVTDTSSLKEFFTSIETITKTAITQ